MPKQPKQKRKWCQSCNTTHAERLTNTHMREFEAKQRSKTAHCSAHGVPSVPDQNDVPVQNDIDLDHDCEIPSGPEILMDSFRALVTQQVLQFCSLLFYLCLLNSISHEVIEMILMVISPFLPELAGMSYDGIRGILGIQKHQFTKFAVCPTCASLKTLQELQSNPICDYAPFGKVCNTLMARDGSSGRKVPLKTYAYNSLTKQLDKFMARPGFRAKLESWRSRKTPRGTLADVYDGQIWSDFQTHRGVPFLAKHGNLALMLNYDGFQPWKRRVYSVDAVYISIMNLPRSDGTNERIAF